ncbi:MAG TPA: hypothetical protein VED40_16895 [Azospirillaceae bacterium]|nr:hypothetical protein [Azospirillaceae bacterium]
MSVHEFKTRRLLGIGLEKGFVTLDDIYRFFPPRSVTLMEFLDVIDRIAEVGLRIAPTVTEHPTYSRWRS